MASDDKRALLEAIAYGDDARVTPGDRLRALEQLDALGDPAPALRAELAAASDEEVDRLWDAHLAHEAPLLLQDGPLAQRYPNAAAALRKAALQYQPGRRSARWRAEVERRARALAQRDMPQRALPVAASGSGGTPEDVAATPTPNVVHLPTGLSQQDVDRPWRRPRERDLFGR
jgi:hypothetical protein